MKKFKSYLVLFFITFGFLGSCTKDLDKPPIDSKITTSATVFDNPQAYKQFLAKLYGSLTLTGQKGEAGAPEISAPDEGTTSFLRELWSAQEVTTDECLNAWGDPGLVEYHGFVWSDANSYVKLMYERIFINIAYCNEYIRATNEKLPSLDGALQTDVKRYAAEARFLRAYYYWCALDLYGNVPFVTEKDKPGAYLPKQISRKDLFDYVASELTAIIPDLADAGANEYARADKAAAWALQARLYLNGEVYTGKPYYTEAITACKNIMSSGRFQLHPKYTDLFLADNDKWRDEIILPIACDGTNTRDYGGTTFIVHASVGGSEDPALQFGIASGGWSGNRITTTFANKFADQTGNTDKRALFYTQGQDLEISKPTIFTQGYLSTKFRNVTSTKTIGKNSTFVDTDFPLFRLGEVYLNYAEAVIRGGAGGDMGTALTLVNNLRTRAYGGSTGNINSGQLTLNFMIDERGRELHWEAIRRTDLIRFNLFTTGAYLWDWKGNVKGGKAVDAHFRIFPIPSSDLLVNTNLVQNPGY
ncbi:hypothetical protein ABIB40_002741 [Pedobacter sp. UYP30]|uniref:RagB/SusD family nutrient uptake outer membrane protein n=1 Tax=Pedobacter sp. UYP30 TaxID=1756400 RepID=UPI0033923F80